MIRSLAKVGGNTLLSRVLGFVRDLVLARVFGADGTTDAFFVAFKIPNFLRRLFAEGAFAVAFVPVLTEYKTTRGFGDLKTFVDHVAGTLGLVLLAVSVLGVVGAPVLIAVFAPGWAYHGAEQVGLATELLRLTFPYLLFISLTAFAGGILNAHDRFGVPAFTPVLLNLCLIAGALWLAPRLQTPILALGWSVLIAGIAQFAFQLPFLHRLRLLPRFTPGWRDPGVRRVLKLMAPAIFGVAVTQINLLLDTLIASFLVSGSISWLYYSDRLLEFPVGVLGVALGTVILPSLSARHAEADPGHFAGTLDWAVRWVFLLGVPAAVGLIMLAGPLISTLFQSRVFDAHDVGMATRSLVTYSIGLLPFMLIKVLAPGFYARQDVKTPVKIAVVAMLVNMVMNLVLVWHLKHAGLALATSLAAATNATLLWVMLRRQGIFHPGRPLRRVVVRAVLASAIMAVVLWQGSGTLESWTTAPLAAKVWRLSLWVGAGAASYFAAAFLFGIRARDFRR